MNRLKWAVFIVAAVVLSGCSPLDDWDVKRLALPKAASDRAHEVWPIWLGGWIAGLVVMILVLGLIFWAMFRYRKRDENEVPAQIRYNLPLEALYTIAPIIAVGVFFFHTAQSQNALLAEVDDPDHTITVVGSKWQWAFDYEDEDAAGGKSVFDVGTPEKIADLYLPVDETVRFNLVSPDVIHSFWVPEFYFKMDVIPGQMNSFDLTPTREGQFTGRCAELCGLYHSRMIFNVHVVSADEYDQHMAELEAKGQIGKPRGQEHAETVAGEDVNGDEN